MWKMRKVKKELWKTKRSILFEQFVSERVNLEQINIEMGQIQI